MLMGLMVKSPRRQRSQDWSRRGGGGETFDACVSFDFLSLYRLSPKQTCLFPQIKKIIGGGGDFGKHDIKDVWPPGRNQNKENSSLHFLVREKMRLFVASYFFCGGG